VFVKSLIILEPARDPSTAAGHGVRRVVCTRDASTYKQSSIISGSGAAIWSESNFRPTAHNHPLPRVRTIPGASAIFKCILEVVFCEGVQHLPLSPQLLQNGGISI
jgi:hypothetical protein